MSDFGPDIHDESDSFLAFLKDNFEAIAVAVIMALVIKHFCVEAFKIPTSSMKPTLRGEHDNERGEGDRILVDKFAYLFTDPDRWHVIVFRYPLNNARNFIKRIAGLPDEHLRISSDGDLWVRPAGDAHDPGDLRIPQKPRDVREQFYRAVYPPPPDDTEDADARAETLRRLWRSGEGTPNRWRVEALDRFEYAGGAAAELRTARTISRRSQPDTWARGSSAGGMVRDVRVRARVRLPGRAAPSGGTKGGTDGGTNGGGDGQPPGDADRPAPTRLSIAWRADDEFLSVLALSSEPGQSRAFIRRFQSVVEEETIDAVLQPGAAVDVELEYVDGALRAHVDGEEVAVLLDGRRWKDTGNRSTEQGLVLKAEGSPLAVEDLRIDRDMCYENEWDSNAKAQRDGVTVPSDSYFMLGDNTLNSSDSRKWRMVRVRFKDGTEILHERGEARYLDDDEAPDEGSWMEVVDADGIRRRWDTDMQDGLDEGFAAPFVKRDLIVGRAFLVFWPCWPHFPGRLGFIH